MKHFQFSLLKVLPLCSILPLLAYSANAVLAQVQVTHLPAFTFSGQGSSAFGRSVDGAGDVNGDGFDDLIVGAPFDGNGSAYVYSGIDGTTLHSFQGNGNTISFGWRVRGAGDINGDGNSDVIVGYPFFDSAQVFSGSDGSSLFDFKSSGIGGNLGRSVGGAGDVNGDGRPDLIVGAPFQEINGIRTGIATVFSGTNGSTLLTVEGDSVGTESPQGLTEGFGISVDGAGDVNADGFADIIVGAFADDINGIDSGSVQVFSGIDGRILHRFEGDSADDNFGFSVSGAGDVNGDGNDDVIVGSFDDNGTGSASVFSGIDGSTLLTLFGEGLGDQFGLSVSGAGDVNGDGLADVIVGARFDDNNGLNSGSATVFSGFDGSMLYQFNGDNAGDGFGRSVSGAGDVNGDGLADFIVGGDGNASVFVSQVTVVPEPGGISFLLLAALTTLSRRRRQSSGAF